MKTERRDDLSYNDIPDFNEDWGLDPRNGFQYSGESVQKFLKEKIQESQSTADEKIQAFHWDVSVLTMYGFTSEERKQLYLDTGDKGYIDSSMPMEFTGTVRQIKIIDYSGGKNLFFTTAQDAAILTVGFISQQKGITDVSWEEVYEDFTVTVSVDKGSKGEWSIVETGAVVLNGNTFSIDVMKYLATGANRVKFTAVGSETGEVGTSTYTLNLTTMYIAPSKFAWNNAFVEGVTYNLGGVNIGGNLGKVLKVRVTNSELSYEKRYEENIGSATFITNAYFFKGLEFPETGTGTYHVEMWLDANGLESEHLHYNIMCVAAADVNSAQLVCINDAATDATNGTDAVLTGYAVYNGTSSTASPSYEVTKNGKVIAADTLEDVPTSAKLNLTVAMEEDTEEASFQVDASVSMGTYTQSIQVNIDNSMSFPAVKGASFYMNAATRSNSQANKGSIVNESDGSEYTIISRNIAYVDGTDGHTVDNNGRKCLLVPAGCSMDIAYKPMAAIGEGWTVEMLYKVSNAADYGENIITVASNLLSDKFQGIRIRPKNVCLHSRDLNTNDLAQSYNTKDEEYVHLIVTIVKNYKTNYGNLAQIYVNGVKKVSFAFTGTDSFAHGANLNLGSSSANLAFCKMRIYERGFGWQDAVQNYINCLPSQAEKIAVWNKIISVMDDSYNISYDAVKGKYNTMVIQMKGNAVLPDVLHPSGGKCDVTFDFPDVIPSELDEDFVRFFSGLTIEDETIEGQGTTAMTYLRWNFRWKLSELYNKRRITAKKNVASSMHSHKMGVTRMYNNLHRTVCGANEANGRVAVYQYPAYGFLKQLVEGTTDQYTYTFIGLYTVGPDKGDKPTFGFDNKAYEKSLIHLEGTDHTPMAVGYDYPWEWTAYSAGKEAMGAITATGEISAAWEVGAAGELEPDQASDEDAVQAMLDSEFRPAYDVIYNNSTSILGVTESLAEMNANPSNWRKNTTPDGKPYSELEFYTHGVFDLYCYNQAEGKFKATGVNVLADLGLSLSDVSGMDSASALQFIKSKRRERFKLQFPEFWVLDDALFNDVFCVNNGASDNFKKNNYPYKFALLAEGGKWRKRQDDLDSVFDINNQGFAAKAFSILLGDKTSTGSGSVFRGENSNFTILLEECYPEEKKRMAHRIFDAMVAQSPYGQTKIEKLVGYVQYCCWDWAQEYFTKGAYNSDAEWTYEEAWPLHTSGVYVNDVNPLAQSQGDHYEAERDWIILRMVFLASYYNWGPFATDNGDDKSTGQISFRAAGGKTYTITPALDHNPTILIGQSDLATAGGRIKAGESCEVVVPDMGNNDTHVYIQGADYLADLGDLKDLKVSADNPNLVVASKRLQRLKVGDVTAGTVTSNVEELNIGACPSLEEIDARNLSSLTGTVNLTQCPRLKKAFFSGSNAANISIAQGSKVEEVSLPGSLTTLSLVKLLNLNESNLIFDDLGNIAYLRLENNAQMDGWEMLKNAYANSPLLRNIRVVGFDYVGDSSDVDMIADFATGVDENGIKKYYGIDAEGNATTGLPILDGNLTVTTPVYEDALNAVSKNYPNLKIDAPQMYLRFADPEVLRVLLANGVGDGVGITNEDVVKVTDIGLWFMSNKNIRYFDEFEKFIGVTTTKQSTYPIQGAFAETTLERIKLPQSLTVLGNGIFASMTTLETLDMTYVTQVGYMAFYRNTGIVTVITPNLTEILGGAFYNCTSLESIDLSKVVVIPAAYSWNGTSHGCFHNCTSLKSISLSPETTSIGNSAFYNCTSLEIEDLQLPNLESLGKDAFYGVKIKKISNLGKLTSLSTIGMDKECLEEVNLSNITNITHNVFEGCVNLVNVEGLSNLTTIASSAFKDCANLSMDIDLPNVVDSLINGQFYNSGITGLMCNVATTGRSSGWGVWESCKSLRYAILPNIVTLGERSFAYCDNLEYVLLGDLVTAVGFASMVQCKSLKTLIIKAATPPTYGNQAMSGTSVLGSIYVHNDAVSAYKESSGWSYYASIIKPISDLQTDNPTLHEEIAEYL